MDSALGTTIITVAIMFFIALSVPIAMFFKVQSK